jgi:hypothetical protein
VGFIGPVALFTFPRPSPKASPAGCRQLSVATFLNRCLTSRALTKTPAQLPEHSSQAPFPRDPPLEFIGGKCSRLGCSFPEDSQKVLGG